MAEFKLEILQSVLGSYYKSNKEFLFYCPKCKHHKRKLSISLEKNVYKCWVCNYAGGPLYKLVKRFGNDIQYRQWVNLEPESDIAFDKESLKQILSGMCHDVSFENSREEKIDLPKEFISLVYNNSTASLPAKNFLFARGINQTLIDRWRIGYCNAGEYANRIIVPSIGRVGFVTYFVARTYVNDYIKYLNPQISKDLVFNELDIELDKSIILVENVFDAIKIEDNAVPLLGSILKEESALFQSLLRCTEPLYIALDLDAEKKEEQIIKMFKSYGKTIYKIDLFPFQSVGDMNSEQFQQKKECAMLSSGVANMKKKLEYC